MPPGFVFVITASSTGVQQHARTGRRTHIPLKHTLTQTHTARSRVIDTMTSVAAETVTFKLKGTGCVQIDASSYEATAPRGLA